MITETFKVTRQWILAGKAIFTVKNDKGDHYTFKVSKVEGEQGRGNSFGIVQARPPIWFLNILTGPDNESDYTYVGVVEPLWKQPGLQLGLKEKEILTVRLTAKSRYTEDSQPVKVARWALKIICNGLDLPAGYSIDGEGRCGRCGKTLTHPDGIADDGFRLGFGPVCWQAIQAGE